ncbi:unnamed protein product [Brassica rapa]|uniref:Uncharacterized protein n=2 Tax=Brassica TaxID=3705 RepID=A0A8D9GY91_BRACM|nr:unnamed protein product [Brassica napus]CAG7889305.1 unnamed protein product [Brassica rapa]
MMLSRKKRESKGKAKEVAQREDEADDLHLHSSLWSMTSAFIRADAALSPFSLQ